MADAHTADPFISYRYNDGRIVHAQCSSAHRFISAGDAAPLEADDSAAYTAWCKQGGVKAPKAAKAAAKKAAAAGDDGASGSGAGQTSSSNAGADGGDGTGDGEKEPPAEPNEGSNGGATDGESGDPGDGAGSSPGPVAADLEKMTKPELEKLAAERKVEVTRADGKDLNPLKTDYVRVLSQA